MTALVSRHYGGGGRLAERIADDLHAAGLRPGDLRPSDFEPVDEFHFRGREATRQLLDRMTLAPEALVLDIGSGLGGVARTIAEISGAHVTGVDLTAELCAAAAVISDWTGLGDRTAFQQGDATDLPFADHAFDGAVTVHVAMNIPDKAAMYAEAHRVLKPGARFGIYDIVQGEGGEILFPVPWASDRSISHLATPDHMSRLLQAAGFRILHEEESTAESLHWLEDRSARPKPVGALPATTQLLFGGAARDMTRNQIQGLRERRMLTYSFICEA